MPTSAARQPALGPAGGEEANYNFYDDPRFFEAYRRMREDPQSANERIEQPSLRACFPPLEGLEELELGRGMGHLSLYLAKARASRVLATDVKHAKRPNRLWDGDREGRGARGGTHTGAYGACLSPERHRPSVLMISSVKGA